jgi:hypothetical protein
MNENLSFACSQIRLGTQVYTSMQDSESLLIIALYPVIKVSSAIKNSHGESLQSLQESGFELVSNPSYPFIITRCFD